MQKSSVNVYAGICKWLKRGAFLQKSIVLKIGKLLINRLENQKGFPSMQVFFYICEYLGVTPSEFFDNANNFPSEYKEILEDLKALDAGQLHNIKAIIKDLRH